MAARKKSPARPDAEQAKRITIALPSVRSYRLWTPGQLRTAQAAADAGNLRHAADICDWLLGDERVRGALDARVGAVFGAPVTFERSRKGRRGGAAVRKLEAGEDWDAMFPEPQARLVMYFALLLGLGPGVFSTAPDEDHDGRDIPRLRFYHPQGIRWDWDARTWLRTLEHGQTEPITFGDGVWLGHMPFGDYRPWLLGLWRGLAPWVLLKAYAVSDLGRAGESAARNVVEGDVTADLDKKGREELAAQIEELARDGTIILPPGFTYDLVELSAATPLLYEKQINLANEGIAVAIRGGNLTTNVQGGSRAAAEVQERQGDLVNLRADTGAWAVTAHDQALKPWARWNFGDAQLAPWPTYTTKPDEDLKVKADTLNVAADAVGKFENLGFELDRKAFADAFNASDFLKPGERLEPDDEDEALDPEEAADEDDEEADSRAKLGRLVLAEGSDFRVLARSRKRGVRDGQAYADALRRRMVRHGSKQLARTLAAVIATVRKAKDYDDARTKLLERYQGMAPPKKLAELLDAAMILANEGGRLAVRRDVPELEDEE